MARRVVPRRLVARRLVARREIARRRVASSTPQGLPQPSPSLRRVWLFDLDDTLHDAATASMPQLHDAMNAYIVQHLGLDAEAATALRRRYWLRYGATLLGLMRHHGVRAAHFLHHTHQLPGLEQRLRGHAADLALLARLPGRKVLLTNAPAHYARRVLHALGLARLFEAVIAIEHMAMFGHLRPKPDARMLRRVATQLGVPPSRCVLVEDTLAHQKAARRVGLRTVWMQRWLPAPSPRRPAYVNLRIRGLRGLRRSALAGP